MDMNASMKDFFVLIGMMAPPAFAKRPMGAHPGPPMQGGGISKSVKKKKKLADKILPQKVHRGSLRQLIESNTYLTHSDLTNFLKIG